MNKAKLMKTGLTLAGLVLTGVATLISDKVKSTEMEETVNKKVSEKVAEILSNQVKES